MDEEPAGTCRHRAYWVLTGYKVRRRAGRSHPSALSEVTCTAPGCGRVWRTKAGYVETLRKQQGGTT